MADVTSAPTTDPDGTTVTVAFDDPDGARAREMRDYVSRLADNLADDVLVANGSRREPGLARRVSRGEWVSWQAAEGVTVYEDVSSGAVMWPYGHASRVPCVRYREPDFGGTSDDYVARTSSTDMTGVMLSVLGEPYALPHLSGASAMHGTTCVVAIEPGFLDFDPSRDHVVDDARTRDFERWLQATLYDHERLPDDEATVARLARDRCLWRDGVSSLDHVGAGWRATVWTDATTDLPHVIPETHPFVHDAIEPALALLDADAHYVSLSGRDSCAIAVATPDVRSLSRRDGVTRASLARLEWPHDRPVSGGEAAACAVSNWMLAGEDESGLAFRGTGRAPRRGPAMLVGTSDLVRALKARPVELGCWVVADELVDGLVGRFPDALEGPARLREAVRQAEEARRAASRARRAGAGRREAPALDPRAASDARDALVMAARRTPGSYVEVPGRTPGGAEPPVDVVAIRAGATTKSWAYSVCHAIGNAIASLERGLGLPARGLVVSTLALDDLVRAQGAAGVTLLAAVGFSEGSRARLAGLPASPLAAGVIPGLTRPTTPSLTIDAAGLATLVPERDVLGALVRTGTIELACATWLGNVLRAVPDVEVPAWAAPYLARRADDGPYRRIGVDVRATTPLVEREVARLEVVRSRSSQLFVAGILGERRGYAARLDDPDMVRRVATSVIDVLFEGTEDAPRVEVALPDGKAT